MTKTHSFILACRNANTLATCLGQAPSQADLVMNIFKASKSASRFHGSWASLGLHKSPLNVAQVLSLSSIPSLQSLVPQVAIVGMIVSHGAGCSILHVFLLTRMPAISETNDLFHAGATAVGILSMSFVPLGTLRNGEGSAPG